MLGAVKAANSPGPGNVELRWRDGKGGINRANMYTHARQTRGSPCGNGTGSMRAGLSMEAACPFGTREDGCKSLSHATPPFAEVILTELPVQCGQSRFSKPRDKRVFRLELETSPRDGCLSPHGDLVCGVAPWAPRGSFEVSIGRSSADVERPGET